jgi:hypothetical protein
MSRNVRWLVAFPVALLLGCQDSPTQPTVRPVLDVAPNVGFTDNTPCDQTISSCRQFGYYGQALEEFQKGQRANCALLDAMVVNGQGAAENESFSCDTLVGECYTLDFHNPDAGSGRDCMCLAARCFACIESAYFYETNCKYHPMPDWPW